MNKELTQEQIKEKALSLKKKHNLKEIWVLESEGKIAFVKKPSRDQLKYAMSVSQNDPLGLAENVLESGWLEGDEELKTNDRYFLDITTQIDALIETTTVNIKKY
ncbi:hypothetical protein GGR32_000136 [Mesonia hippocampi]|uniref:Uncharacterized protein n=1 Tax=Mesonia hippocampi TaxID=1628250 RepID=A0A840EUV0_9FLAO|nr:hypothetical protein [Mesonia hippocampi]MBB4117864.1 hypothetical protein [Mesonia hippocampi]